MSIVSPCRRHQVLITGLVLSVSLLVLRPGTAWAQSAHETVLQEIGRAFGQGDARILLNRAADRLEISLFNESTLYSRAQALYVMQAFFRQYPPVRFVYQEHQGASDSWFAAAVYWCDPAERPLRVYVRLRERDSTWELREIRVDEQRR